MVKTQDSFSNVEEELRGSNKEKFLGWYVDRKIRKPKQIRDSAKEYCDDCDGR
jgi:hypothetical protein